MTTLISAGSWVIPASFSDTATINGGDNPGGTVTFNVYSGSDSTACTGAVIATSTNSVVSGTTVTDYFGALGLGNYEVQAVYSGDTNNAGTTSPCGSEPGTVTQATPSIGTVLSPVDGNVVVGGSFSDTANVTGGDNPSGTVTFNVYTGSGADVCSGTPFKTDAGETLASGRASSQSWTLGVGTYEVQAVYSGDTNNAGKTSTCGDESVNVGLAAPTVSTELSLILGRGRGYLLRHRHREWRRRPDRHGDLRRVLRFRIRRVHWHAGSDGHGVAVGPDGDFRELRPRCRRVRDPGDLQRRHQQRHGAEHL